METTIDPSARVTGERRRRVKNQAYMENATLALLRGGYRRTCHTDRVIGVLADSPEPLGALDIKRLLQREGGEPIHFTAVYRILSNLVNSRAVLVVAALSPNGKGTAYIRREDCGDKRPGIPFVVVDLCLSKAEVVPPHPELVEQLRAYIKANQLPDSDYSVQIVVGNSVVDEVTS